MGLADRVKVATIYNSHVFIPIDSDLLARATKDVFQVFTLDNAIYPFTAQWMFIVTWSNVTYNGGFKNIVRKRALLFDIIIIQILIIMTTIILVFSPRNLYYREQ